MPYRKIKLGVNGGKFGIKKLSEQKPTRPELGRKKAGKKKPRKC